MLFMGAHHVSCTGHPGSVNGQMKHMCVYVCMCIYTYVYICIHINNSSLKHSHYFPLDYYVVEIQNLFTWNSKTITNPFPYTKCNRHLKKRTRLCYIKSPLIFLSMIFKTNLCGQLRQLLRNHLTYSNWQSWTLLSKAKTKAILKLWSWASVFIFWLF